MKQKTSKEYMRIPNDNNKIVEIVEKKIITKDGKRNIYCLCKEKDPDRSSLNGPDLCFITGLCRERRSS